MVEVPRSIPIFFDSTVDSIPDNPGKIVADVTLALDAGDMRAQAFELAHDFLVTTVEVIDVVEHRRPVGAEGGDHERRAGSDVRHRDRAPVQRAGTGDDGAAALDVDIRPELAKLGHMLKSVFEDGFRYMAPSVRLRHYADEGRLQVGRKPGVGPGRHVDRLQLAVAPHPETVHPIFDLDASRPQLEDHGTKVGGLDIFQHTLAAGGRDRERVGSRLDVVGDHTVGRATQFVDAFDLQHIGADPVNPGSHLAEEHRQVDDVRLACRVVDGGDAVGRGGGHHQVLGSGHRWHVEMDGGALQAVGARDILTALELDAGAHQAQPDEVLFDAAHADVIPARLGHASLAAAGQQRTHQEEEARIRFAIAASTSLRASRSALI